MFLPDLSCVSGWSIEFLVLRILQLEVEKIEAGRKSDLLKSVPVASDQASGYQAHTRTQNVPPDPQEWWLCVEG